MQSVNVLTENLERALKQFPERREAAVKRASALAEQRVKSEVGQRLNDSHGVIASWQAHTRTGSGGGYGVVEALGGSRAKMTGRPATGVNSPGAITNYLEHGHKIRGPKVAGRKGYRPRIHVASVSGRWFYRATAEGLDRLVLQAANEVCADMAKIIEGG